jgi:hypothetical protein
MSDDIPTATLPESLLRAAETNILFERAALSRVLGMTFGDKRDVYGVLGYKGTITASEYRAKYARGGIAGRVVDAKPKAVWRGVGDLYEDEDPEKHTPFEEAWTTLNKTLNIWSTLQRAHILASLGSFSVILIGAAGDLSTELPRSTNAKGIFYLTPFGGGVVNNTRGAGGADILGADVTIKDWDKNSTSPRFGQPLTYQLKRTNIDTPDTQRPVHWSRMVHIPAEGFLDDAIYGPPTLESVWNYLDDLDKVVGGGAEAFWLRANQGIQLDVDKKMDLAAAQASLEELKKQAEMYEHQMTRMLRTRGVNVNTLGSDVADFKNPADVILTLIAGTAGIPKRILTGSEMGELASSQDRDNWNDQIKDCRTSYASPVLVRPLVDRLIKYGYLPTPKQYEVEWPDTAAMTEVEQLDAATKMIGLNDHGEIVVTANEVREYLGMEELDPLVVAAQEEKDQTQIAQFEAALRRSETATLTVRGK